MKWFYTKNQRKEVLFLFKDLVNKEISKVALVRSLGVSRSSLYYKPLQPKKDEKLREQIIRVLAEHPAYGHRRIALTLNMGKNRVNRVMRKYGITPKIQRKKRRHGRNKAKNGVPNRLKDLVIKQPNQVWVGDFTELRFHHKRMYLATVLDSYTREVLGWQLGIHHTTSLVVDVLEDAFRKKRSSPSVFHSDQGSEYTAHACLMWLTSHHIVPSHSAKGKPWQNGRQESFFNTFKLEFRKPSRHKTIPDLTEAIGRYIHYYNTRRIHSALKMPPEQFREKSESGSV